VIWSLRGATLLATLLSSMPLWKTLDPLPILEERQKEREQDEAGKPRRKKWFRRRGKRPDATKDSGDDLGSMVS